MMIDELEKLCNLNGTSGSEDEVRDYIINQIKNLCEYRIDNMGNVIAYKKGTCKVGKKLMISAHMDEVGMIVTYINDDGTLKIAPVGGIDPRVVFGRRVRVGKEKRLGVIGSKAVHNLSKEERDKAVTFEGMYVDIGCTSREEAEKIVSLGDNVYFDSDFVRLGDRLVKGKAIDDRAGVAVMLRMIREELPYDVTFAFVVQEEIGLRGSRCAAFEVDPEYAIVIESTTAADIPSASGSDRVCELGKGPVVSFMDRSTIYNKELYDLAFDLADKNNIPCQTKTRVAGGNDAGAIHITRGGIKTAAVSLATRYLHSPSCVADIQDFENVYKLVRVLSDSICSK